MKKQINRLGDENGFVLIASLLILLVLTIMGIAVNRNTTTESQIAVNDRIHKETFYNADAATELASEILEQNLACMNAGSNGFSTSRIAGDTKEFDIYINPNSKGFWRKFSEEVSIPSESDRDIAFPAVFTSDSDSSFNLEKTRDIPHANINIGGDTEFNTGAAIQMGAGYEGLGKAISLGGASILYDIKVQQLGRYDEDSQTFDSESVIVIQYAHVLGQEGATPPYCD